MVWTTCMPHGFTSKQIYLYLAKMIVIIEDLQASSVVFQFRTLVVYNYNRVNQVIHSPDTYEIMLFDMFWIQKLLRNRRAADILIS